ncbi:MAG: transglutaminase-like domain-containing protein [Kofleriaceae bacterium]
MPPEITERTRALAAELTAGATTDYDRVEALRSYLRTQLRYTLEQRDPRGQEPIDFFLFDRRAGHCEYFASALAIMARTLGIPTRNVAGFLGGEWNEYDGYIAVRSGDAHSWVEVFYPTVGWVTVDPTPPAQDALGRGSDGVLARISRFLDTLRFQWTRWVVDYDLASQLSLFKSVGSALKGGAQDVRAQVARLGRAVRDHALLSGAVIAAIALLVWARARRRRSPGAAGGGRDRRRRGAVAAAYLDARARLGRLGVGTDRAQTPREVARARAASGAADAAALTELTDLYYAVEYGAAPDEGAATRARTLRDELVRRWREAARGR